MSLRTYTCLKSAETHTEGDPSHDTEMLKAKGAGASHASRIIQYYYTFIYIYTYEPGNGPPLWPGPPPPVVPPVARAGGIINNHASTVLAM